MRHVFVMPPTLGAELMMKELPHASVQVVDDGQFISSWTKLSEGEKKQSILVLCGGDDISPSLYGEKTAFQTMADDTPSRRDAREVKAFEFARDNGIFVFGICRGAQLACALSGGKLIQHVDKHQSGHPIQTEDGDYYQTSSAHHQMMQPQETDHRMIAWSAPSRSSVYVFNDDHIIKKQGAIHEPEIVYFRKTHALGIQGHPEWMSLHSPLVGYTFNLIEKGLNHDL